MNTKVIPDGWYTLAASVSKVVIGRDAPVGVVSWLDRALGDRGAQPIVVHKVSS